MMSKTLLEKIWHDHCIKHLAEKEDLIYIDMHLLHEINTPQAFSMLQEKKRLVRHPELTIATVDHNTPTKSKDSLKIDDLRRRQIDLLEKNCKEFGIPFKGLGEPDQGITHVIAPEQGLVLPGTTLVCCDSHTTTHGAFATLAIGIGTSQVEHVLATQTLRIQEFKTMRITIDNTLKPNVSAKDLALHIIRKIGTGGGFGYVIEYSGEAISALSMEGRMTLCNMSVEAGAGAAIIGVDNVTIEYLKKVYKCSEEDNMRNCIERWKKFKSDSDAIFDKEIQIDALEVKESVTWGINPSQSIHFDEQIPKAEEFTEQFKQQEAIEAYNYMKLRPGQKLEDINIDKVFIGSCTNGRIEDLRIVAEILNNRKIHPRVKMIIVPGSVNIRDQAIREGLDRIYTKAGAEFRYLPGCSMCVGLNEDSMKSGERSVSTSNRNFEGRQGPGSMTHIASPAIAAASAIMGRISNVSNLIREENA